MSKLGIEYALTAFLAVSLFIIAIFAFAYLSINNPLFFLGGIGAMGIIGLCIGAYHEGKRAEEEFQKIDLQS